MDAPLLTFFTPPPTLALFGPLDWSIVALYFALVIAVGFWVSRKHSEDNAEVFLAGRSMPTWAVALSLVATMLSAVTFVGVPDIAYKTDLSYLILNIGGLIAVFLVAFTFIPKLYHAGTVTIYGFLAQRFGPNARLAVSCTFIFGRLLSSGARLFIAAIPLCLLLFNSAHPPLWQVLAAIALIGVVGTIYATAGGVRAVVWVDTIQFTLVLGTALLTIGILLHRLNMPLPDIFTALTHPPTGPSKLTLLDTSLDPTKEFTLWTALLGNTFLMTAALGVDHDLAQRFLISKSSFRAGVSAIASQFIGIVVVTLFLVIGLLLFLFYEHAHLAPKPTQAGLAMYPWFLLHELPTGLAGISIVGFFAIAQGSLDSAMNALAASIVADVYLPLREQWSQRSSTSQLGSATSKPRDSIPGPTHSPEISRGSQGESLSPPSPPLPETPGGSPELPSPPTAPNPPRSHAPKLTVAAVGITMTLFAMLCAAAFDPKASLLSYVLSLMTFAYSGMLGVFLTALFTRRGNTTSVIAALLVGLAVSLILHMRILPLWTNALFHHELTLAWPWTMPAATLAAFLTCLAGRKPRPE